MSLKIEALPQLTKHHCPRKGETGEHILASHRKAETLAALVSAVKSPKAARRVRGRLDQIAGRA